MYKNFYREKSAKRKNVSHPIVFNVALKKLKLSISENNAIINAYIIPIENYMFKLSAFFNLRYCFNKITCNVIKHTIL